MPRIQSTSRYKIATKPIYLRSVDTLLQLWDDTKTAQEGFIQRAHLSAQRATTTKLLDILANSREALAAKFNQRMSEGSWFEIVNPDNKVVMVVLGRYSVPKNAYITGWELLPEPALIPDADKTQILTIIHAYVRNKLQARSYIKAGYPTDAQGGRLPEINEQCLDSELVDYYTLLADEESDYNMTLNYKTPDASEDTVWRDLWDTWETEQRSKTEADMEVERQ